MELSDAHIKILVAYCRRGNAEKAGGDAACNDSARLLDLFATVARTVASPRSVMTIDEYAKHIDPEARNLSAANLRRLFDTHGMLADFICKSWIKARRNRILAYNSKHTSSCLTPPSMPSDTHG